MNKLAALIKELPYDDLLKLRKDIAEGNMLRLVEERIAAHENPNRVCPVCNTPIDPETAITLYFGPKGLRHRASFDGEDCLEYFVKEMLKPKPAASERSGKGDDII
jgi:hypothetical protein